MSNSELFIQMAVTAWASQNKQVDKLINTLPSGNWQNPTAPGRNTGLYILGHLTAVNDGIITILGLGKKLRPEWEEIFIKNPDKSELPKPSLEEVKKAWKEINQFLESSFKKMSSDDWFGRHMSVSPEDFSKEPHRNKLNVLLSRTNHQSYHVGQLKYLSEP